MVVDDVFQGGGRGGQPALTTTYPRFGALPDSSGSGLAEPDLPSDHPPPFLSCLLGKGIPRSPGGGGRRGVMGLTGSFPLCRDCWSRFRNKIPIPGTDSIFKLSGD